MGDSDTELSKTNRADHAYFCRMGRSVGAGERHGASHLQISARVLAVSLCHLWPLPAPACGTAMGRGPGDPGSRARGYSPRYALIQRGVPSFTHFAFPGFFVYV